MVGNVVALISAPKKGGAFVFSFEFRISFAHWCSDGTCHCTVPLLQHEERRGCGASLGGAARVKCGTWHALQLCWLHAPPAHPRPPAPALGRGCCSTWCKGSVCPARTWRAGPARVAACFPCGKTQIAPRAHPHFLLTRPDRPAPPRPLPPRPRPQSTVRRARSSSVFLGARYTSCVACPARTPMLPRRTARCL